MMVTNVVCGKTKGWTFLFNGKESSITDSRWDAEINEKMIVLESRENELSELIKHKTEEKKNLEAQIKSSNAQVKKADDDEEKQLLKDKLSDFQIDLGKIDTLLKTETENLAGVKSSIKGMIEDAPKNEIEALWKFFKKGGKAESYISSDNDKVKDLKQKLIYIHSLKVKEIDKTITKKDFTRELEKEYNTKKEEALKALESNDFSYFELSAQLKGVTSKQYAQLVLQKANEMLDIQNQALRKVGDIRSFIGDLIESKKFFQAQKMLEYMETVKPEIIIGASNEQLVEIIQTYSN